MQGSRSMHTNRTWREKRDRVSPIDSVADLQNFPEVAPTPKTGTPTYRKLCKIEKENGPRGGLCLCRSYGSVNVFVQFW